MLDMAQIKEFFEGGTVRVNLRGMLVEYLQYELLDSLFKLPGSEKISFIGGTAVRLIYDGKRFSEDLDFDNFGLDYPSFKELVGKACAEMKVKGLQLELRFLRKEKVYHGYIKFPGILSRFGASPHPAEKIFISIDAEQKPRIFTPEIKILNKFGVFRKIAVNPAPVLLSQKLLAILFRKREKGRDFYDVSFLAGMTRPDYEYLEKMTGLKKEDIIKKITARCSHLNFKALAQDVEPFLFDADQKRRVLDFKESLPGIL